MGLSMLKLESSGTPRCCRAGSQAAKGQKRIEVLARRGFVAHALGPIWGAKEVRPSPGSDLQNSIYSFIQILIECLLGVRHWGLCRGSIIAPRRIRDNLGNSVYTRHRHQRALDKGPFKHHPFWTLQTWGPQIPHSSQVPATRTLLGKTFPYLWASDSLSVKRK